MNKNKNLLILGAGQYGQVAKETAELMGSFGKISFLDDRYVAEDGKCKGKQCDKSIIGAIDGFNGFVEEYAYAFVAIGNPAVRFIYTEKLKDAGYCIPVLVHPKAYVSPSAQIGEGSIVEAMAVVNANTTIAECTYVCAGAVVNHNCVIGEGCTLQCGSDVPANSVMPEKTMLGYNEVYVKKYEEPIEKRTPVGNDYKFEDGM